MGLMNACTKTLLSLLVTLLTGLTCLATDYHTLLRDKTTGEAVAGATALLMAPDSTTLAVVVSDAEGAVRLSGEGACCLRISHLMYHPLTVDLVGATLPDTLRLEPRSELLEELVVSTDRPVMKLLEGGISSYDVELLFEKSPVSTAYEMLCRLPGMREEGGVPVLAGVSGFTLVMNGKPSSLPQDQLLEQLKSIPVSQVASAEISYTPIARYRAKGASVNIVLKHQSRERISSGLSAQLFGTYTSQYYSRYAAGGSALYTSPSGLSISGRYGAGLGDRISDLSVVTGPLGSLSEIRTRNVGKSSFGSHTLTLDLGYRKGRHDLSATYYGTFSPNNQFVEKDIERSHPIEQEQESQRRTHHLSVEYGYDGHLMIGAFYTDYHQSQSVTYGTGMDATPSEAFAFDNGQQSRVVGAHVDNSHRLGGGWGIEYGSKFSLSHTANRQQQWVVAGETQTTDPIERVSRELLADIYLGVKKQLSSALSIDATLIGDYARYYGHEETFRLMPQASLLYRISQTDMLQLSFNSQKKYPAYFEREPYSTQRSAVQMWQGNPEIRPFVTYNAQAVYVLRGKYQFVIRENYAPRYFVQQMYLDPELEKIVYKTWNWHYYNNLSLTAVAPLPKTDWWQGRLVLDVSPTWIKLDVPFVGTVDRRRTSLFGSLSNDFVLSQRNGLTAGLDFSYITGGMQGLYDFSDIVNLSARMKWVSRDKKWSVTLRGNDLLEKGTPKIKANQGVQQFEFVPSRYGRNFSLDIRYTFGNYKSVKSPSQLDTSRFGM